MLSLRGGTDTMTGLLICSDLIISALVLLVAVAVRAITCIFRDDAAHLSQPGELMMKDVTPIVHSEK